MTDREAKRCIPDSAVAREHLRVLEMIEALEQSGEIEKGELDYYKRLAQKWLKIARDNRTKGIKLK